MSGLRTTAVSMCARSAFRRLATALGSGIAESSTRYDAWGNALESCAGADLALAGAGACLRTARVDYDAAYSQLPVSESTAVDTSDAPFRYLSTTATWDRGFGVLRSATDPNGDTTSIAYDGLARLSYLRPPTVPGCDMGERPPQRFFYDLVPGGRPVSVIRSSSNEGDATCAGDLFIEKRSYIDGLRRTRAELTDTGSPARGWEKAGVPRFTRRGTSYRVRAHSSARPRSVTASLPVLRQQDGPLRGPSHVNLFGRATRSYERDGAWVAAAVYHALGQEAWDARDLETGGPYAATPSITRVDGHGRTLETLVSNIQPDGAHEVYRLETTYRADDAVVSVTRSEAANLAPGAPVVTGPDGRARTLTRVFTYDTAGRRIAATDPDTDSRDPSRPASARTWRYLFNRVGDLAAVRDPRGCGDNFYYDVAGRLLGEDYVTCGEAQPSGLFAVTEVPAGSIGLDTGDAHDVDARSYYDDAPDFALDLAQSQRPPDAGHLLGRASGALDRAARSLVAYDARGQALWSGVQMAMLPSANPSLAAALSDPPMLDTADAPVAGSIAFDVAHSYQSTSHYDHLGRADGLSLPDDPDAIDAPRITGALTFNRRGLVSSASLGLAGTSTPGAPGAATVPILRSVLYDADRRATRSEYGPISGAGFPLADTMAYDARKRPRRMLLTRTPTEADLGDHPLGAVTTVTDTVYTWDAADNLLVSADLAPASQFPAGYRPRRQQADHDALYRVTGVASDYGGVDAEGADSGFTPDDAASDWREERERTNLDSSSHQQADPMRRRPAPMASALPEGRTADLRYRYDWLGNMTEWTDDAGAFYERSLGDEGQLLNGFDIGSQGRPGALYFSSNIRTATGGAAGDIDPTLDRGGWLDMTYGEGGNAETLTVHAQCHDRDAATACADEVAGGSGSLTARADHLRAACACQVEQHYQYRYDELNRLTEARRYDRGGLAGGTGGAGGPGDNWQLAARQRYGYDASNTRRVKETLGTALPGAPGGATTADPEQAIALYVLPGDLERRGLVRSASGLSYEASPTLGTETQYLVAGARVVWKDAAAPDPSQPLDPDHRITLAAGDLLGSVSCVVDLESGDLIERSTYYPNGARETQQATGNQSLQLEPLGFTGKEADEEVGLVYFGQRYLIPGIARWSTPDPLQIHALGGGEPFSSYHYISGNLLQATDPLGLWSSADIGSLSQPVHQIAIDRVLGSRIASNHFLNGLKTQQVTIDRDQSSQLQYRHAMRDGGARRADPSGDPTRTVLQRPEQSVRDAARLANNWIRSELRQAITAYQAGHANVSATHLGNAIHTFQDATSPSHRGFQQWGQMSFLSDARHVAQELHYPKNGSQELANLEGATLRIFDLFLQGASGGRESVTGNIEVRNESDIDSLDFFRDDGSLVLDDNYTDPDLAHGTAGTLTGNGGRVSDDTPVSQSENIISDSSGTGAPQVNTADVTNEDE